MNLRGDSDLFGSASRIVPRPNYTGYRSNRTVGRRSSQLREVFRRSYILIFRFHCRSTNQFVAWHTQRAGRYLAGKKSLHLRTIPIEFCDTRNAPRICSDAAAAVVSSTRNLAFVRIISIGYSSQLHRLSGQSQRILVKI